MMPAYFNTNRVTGRKRTATSPRVFFRSTIISLDMEYTIAGRIDPEAIAAITVPTIQAAALPRPLTASII